MLAAGYYRQHCMRWTKSRMLGFLASFFQARSRRLRGTSVSGTAFSPALEKASLLALKTETPKPDSIIKSCVRMSGTGFKAGVKPAARQASSKNFVLGEEVSFPSTRNVSLANSERRAAG